MTPHLKIAPGELGFDFDGVIADTERDGHRVAFNRAFAKKGLNIEWSVELYGQLLKIAGGKERAVTGTIDPILGMHASGNELFYIEEYHKSVMVGLL